MPKFSLPEVPFRAKGGWLPVLVEPVYNPSAILEIVPGEFDKHTDGGIGWVLGADKGYWYVPPRKRGTQSVVHQDEWTHYYEMPEEIRRGVRILFQRYLRTQGKGQPSLEGVLRQLPADLPRRHEYEAFWIHVEDVIAVLEEEDGEEGAESGSGEGEPQEKHGES